MTTGSKQSIEPQRLTAWSVVCLDCRTVLNRGTHICVCPMCGRHYPIEDGVIRFIDRDAFYENRYLPGMLKFSPNEHTPWGRILLYLVSMHYFWYIRRYIPSGSKILDLACGSGMRYLTTRGAVAGLEVSLSSAREAAKIYDLGLQASAMQIPLDAQSVDAVVSRFFFEHVPVSDKRPLLAEIRRVLQPGGWLITLQDCECNNALWKWAKKDPELFQQWFIENDGHFGLMLVSENLALLRESGFDVIKYYASNKTPLVSLPMLEWMQPYRSKSMMANIGLAAASYISRSKVLNTAYTLSTTLIDDIVERFLPVDKARYLLCASRVPL